MKLYNIFTNILSFEVFGVEFHVVFCETTDEIVGMVVSLSYIKLHRILDLVAQVHKFFTAQFAVSELIVGSQVYFQGH